jgi:SWI/SNF-related matrix-associated actin-dependent regulator 1 of chromatin subfamily A
VNAEEMAARVSVQFPQFSRDEIVGVIKRFPNDPDQAINHLTFMANHGASSSSAPSSSRPGSMASLGQISSTDAVEHVELLPRAKKLGKVGGGKNINSSIYANRNKKDDSPSSTPSAPAHGSKLGKSKTKRRDPDESESEAEAKAGGSDESDMEWSGDEGRRKRKRGDDDDDEVDAQGAALKAFNEDSVEVLTGTIGESLRYQHRSSQLARKNRPRRSSRYDRSPMPTTSTSSSTRLVACRTSCLSNIPRSWRGMSRLTRV